MDGGLGMMPDSSMARYVSTERSWLRDTRDPTATGGRAFTVMLIMYK